MLERFPGFRTKNPEINREVLFANFNVSHFDCKFRERPFIAKANWADTKYVRITSAFCSTSTDIEYEAVPVIRQFFHARPKTRIAFSLNGRTEELSASNDSVIIPADTSFRGVASGEHEVIALKIEIESLRRIASAMLGEDVPVGRLNEERWVNDHVRLGTRPATAQFIADLESTIATNSFAAEIFGQALLIRLLMTRSIGFGAKFRENVQAPSLIQLRGVEDYLAANWQKDIDVLDLAERFGMSVRSIFRHFRSLRGVTPHEFVRQLKLDRARVMLEAAAEQPDGVMTIAIRCGFQSLGHFARAYRKSFGELPSQTLRRGKSADPDGNS